MREGIIVWFQRAERNIDHTNTHTHMLTQGARTRSRCGHW